jgi:hypothetical protein
MRKLSYRCDSQYWLIPFYVRTCLCLSSVSRESSAGRQSGHKDVLGKSETRYSQIRGRSERWRHWRKLWNFVWSFRWYTEWYVHSGHPSSWHPESTGGEEDCCLLNVTRQLILTLWPTIKKKNSPGDQPRISYRMASWPNTWKKLLPLVWQEEEVQGRVFFCIQGRVICCTFQTQCVWSFPFHPWNRICRSNGRHLLRWEQWKQWNEEN